MKQPELMNEWGLPFHGIAHTADGNIWWYWDDNTKRPLIPRRTWPGCPPAQVAEARLASLEEMVKVATAALEEIEALAHYPDESFARHALEKLRALRG